MTLLKENGTSLFPALTDFFESDKWVSPERILRNLTHSFPAANISETDKEYKIELAVPGFKKEDVKINLENEVLIVTAENKTEKEEKTKKYTRKEFSHGSFRRSFQLPKEVNAEKIQAKHEDGLLKLAIPKKEEAVKKLVKKEIAIA